MNTKIPRTPSRNDTVIGIDPDTDKSGVATLKPSPLKHLPYVETQTLTFPALIDYLKEEQSTAIALKQQLTVIVEAGWLNQSNWHLRKADNTRIASAKGNSTGRNHEVGRKIVEICQHYGIEVIEQRPLRKTWKGRDGKITHAEIKAFTRIEGRTNQEERDALLLAWHYAGLPIVINTCK